jgi:hypothetical protein
MIRALQTVITLVLFICIGLPIAALLRIAFRM